jgi:hypothetical protein
MPQFCPAGHDVRGVQPQTLGVPPPPHVCGAVQVPQFTVPPQPFGTVPQLSPAGHVVRGVQPQTPGVPPPPQVCGAVQMPQEPPQPSGPQFLPVHSGVQPHTFATPPPPHVSGAVQVPQLRQKPVQTSPEIIPQSPSGIVPQFFPCAAQVVCVQQIPNRAAPCLTVGFLQSRLQQLMLV